MENDNNNGFDSYGQNTYEQNAYGQNTYEQNTYGQNAYGQNAYSQNTYGQNTYEQNVYGQNYNQEQPPVGKDGKELKNRFGMKLTFSILEIVTILSCNLLTGILGIIACVFTVKADSSFKEKRWDDFKSQAKTSAILLWVGFAGFILEMIVFIIFYAFIFSMASVDLDDIEDYATYGENFEYAIEESDDLDDSYADADTETEEKETESEASESDNSEVAAASEVQAGTGFTDPTITINGATMTFPLSYADFKALGFHISAEDESYVLNTMYYTSVTLYNSNEDVIGYCYLYDNTENSIALSECVVYGVCIQNESYYDVTTDVVLPSGVNMNSSKEDWITAYGTPDYEYESDSYDSQDYQWYAHNDAYYDDSSNSLEVSYWDGVIDEITMQYIGWE